MTDFELPFVDAQRGRDGAVRYWYFRRNGRRWRLPGSPLSDEFMADYRRLLAETSLAGPAGKQGPTRGPGSFGALVLDYLASGDFKEKKPSTQAEYRRVLEWLAERHGHKPSGKSSGGTSGGCETSAPTHREPPIPSCGC